MSVRDVVVVHPRAWADDDDWRRKLEADGRRIKHSLPGRLHDLHCVVVRRALAVGANALILSGSTARGTRTEISDLDYHLVGPRIDIKDLSRELDLHVLSDEKLQSEILAGDDFVQWSLRFGCVVFDKGVVRSALRLIEERRPWPDVDRKREHARRSLDLARRFVATGDEDGALPQVRTALSLVARATLLSNGIFPMSRVELPAQLQEIGLGRTAQALTATIYGSPLLGELGDAVADGQEVLAALSR